MTQLIQRVRYIKFLGIQTNTYGGMSIFNKSPVKLLKDVGIVNKVNSLITSKLLLTLYNSLILHAYLSYCNMIQSLGSSIQIHKLIILQKRFIRIISNANYLSHTDSLFHSLNLLKITDIGQMQTLIFMYKYHHHHHHHHHGVLPTTLFCNYFCKVADVHSYLTRQSTSLHISYARTNQRKNKIKIQGQSYGISN